ncbi:MAG: signal peptidase II [Acidimicrobiales bacterium]
MAGSGSRFGRWVWWALPAVLCATADLASTAWARASLSSSRPRVFMGGLVDLRLVANRGAAFGLGSGHETLVELAAVIFLGALIVVARSQPPLVAAGLGFALGGGLGNLAVRLAGPKGPLQSPVIDWIHLSFYPETFNLADVAIRAGLLIAALGLIAGRKPRYVAPDRSRDVGLAAPSPAAASPPE